MDIVEEIKNNIGKINPRKDTEYTLALFRFQAFNNPVYNKFLGYLGVDPEKVESIYDIPFMPIEFFKTHQIKTGHPIWNDGAPEVIFESSGTTTATTSRHLVPDLAFYKEVTEKGFHFFYGDLNEYHVLALLPAYLERNNASLVVMADHFIKTSNSEYSGFYLNDYQKLIEVLAILKQRGDRKILLIGVSFALLELAEKFGPDLSGVLVMETGGMKGRRKELVREEFHHRLKEELNLQHVHSEYGMTELLSQAYAQNRGFFKTPPWMEVIIRDMNDPFLLDNHLRQGGINIIDLANIYTCSFIETQDIGRYHTQNDSFEVLGRMDNTDIRGCNLLVA